MRKVVITLIMVLCVLASGTGHRAGPREGYIPPLDPGRPTSCADPSVKPATGVAYARHTSARATAHTAAAPAARSNSVFEKFVRCPFGDPSNPDCSNISSWKHADDHIGYYRDVIFAGSTIISNARDGETWTASFVRPDQSQLDFGTVEYDADTDCFNFPGQPPICGSSSIRIFWYFNSQCAQTGLWYFRAYNDGAKFADVQFQFKPLLGAEEELAGKLVPFSQADPAWADDPYGNICHMPGEKITFPCSENKPGKVPWTMKELGCGITSSATVLRYHGVDTDPKRLNAWLSENKLYDDEGDLKDNQFIVHYARHLGVEMSLEAMRSGSFKDVSDNVCLYGPVILRVRDDNHSVVALGQDDGLTTIKILDAMNGLRRELFGGYNNLFDNYTVYAGPEREFRDDRSNVKINFFSPVEAFVVDPLGRRQGLDPRTGTRYDEIPDAFYGGASTIGPERPEGYEPPKLLNLLRPAEGAYTLTVVGTGEGTYDADFVMYDSAHGRSEQQYADIITAPGVVHTYKIEFSKSPGSQLVTTGGFDGGGQRPRDVNKFLSYAQPSDANTALPAGTTSYQLLVFYGAGVIPSTFRAQLNGADVTSLFSPSPGGSQAVALPLQSGRNVLQLSVDGNLPNRVATDSDRLVFEVP